jgi:hypothetical protein
MQPKSRTLAIALTVIAVSAAATTLDSAAQSQPSQARILHLVEKGGNLNVVDNPPKAKHRYDFSPGDIVVVDRVILDQSGTQAGSLHLVCVATTATSQQCSGTEKLADGTIEVAGVSAPDPATTVAVIGGTGAYSGAHGTSTSRDRATNHDVADQTITLLP